MSNGVERIEPSLDLHSVEAQQDFMQSYKTELRRRVRSENTMIAYESDWSHFKKWCKSMGLDSVPASEFTVVAYLNYWGMNPDQEIRLKASTLRRRISAIKFFNQQEGHSVLDYRGGSEDPIDDTITMIARDQKAGVRKAKPISQIMLAHMVEEQPDTLIGLRDSTILLVGFMTAMRRSEITSLEVSDLDFRDRGLVVTIRSSKTDQSGEGHVVHVPFTRHSNTCAVRKTRKWITNLGRDYGPLFSAIDKYGNIKDKPLSDQKINLIVRESLERIDVNPNAYSAHSLRSGFATSAAEAGADIRTIMKQTRHTRFETVEGYIQDGTSFDDNAINLFSQL